MPTVDFLPASVREDLERAALRRRRLAESRDSAALPPPVRVPASPSVDLQPQPQYYVPPPVPAVQMPAPQQDDAGGNLGAGLVSLGLGALRRYTAPNLKPTDHPSIFAGAPHASAAESMSMQRGLEQSLPQVFSPTFKPPKQDGGSFLGKIGGGFRSLLGFQDGGNLTRSLKRPGDTAVVGEEEPELIRRKKDGTLEVVPLPPVVRPRSVRAEWGIPADAAEVPKVQYGPDESAAGYDGGELVRPRRVFSPPSFDPAAIPAPSVAPQPSASVEMPLRREAPRVLLPWVTMDFEGERAFDWTAFRSGQSEPSPLGLSRFFVMAAPRDTGPAECWSAERLKL